MTSPRATAARKDLPSAVQRLGAVARRTEKAVAMPGGSRCLIAASSTRHGIRERENQREDGLTVCAKLYMAGMMGSFFLPHRQ